MHHQVGECPARDAAGTRTGRGWPIIGVHIIRSGGRQRGGTAGAGTVTLQRQSKKSGSIRVELSAAGRRGSALDSALVLKFAELRPRQVCSSFRASEFTSNKFVFVN